jgi:membrane fusion protein (multidrug efflux system)
VIAVPVEREQVAEQAEFVGRVVAVDRVDLRARVPGFLKERRFTEGQEVKADEVLFVIEPDQYQAVVDQRKADVAKAVAENENAQAQLARGEELLKSKNISQAEVDKLRAAQSVAAASIAQAKAALAAAELDLSYTQILAPVAGRIGLAKFTVGNLVGPESGSLATLVSRDPIYVQFPVTQRELLEARKNAEREGRSLENLTVLARLPDDTIYGQKGRLDFVDVTTDQGTDTVTVRAVFPNPDGILVDGQYLGVMLQQDSPNHELVVPQSALQIDQQGTFVLVVDSDNKVQVRRIRTRAAQGPKVAVIEGLKEGDLVISEGIQKVRPGQVVRATPPQSVESSEEVPSSGAPPTSPAGGDGK